MKSLLLLSLLIIVESIYADIDVDSTRLPRHFEPISYDLTLEPDLDNLNFRGWVAIHFRVMSSVKKPSLLSQIELNSDNLNYADYLARLKEGETNVNISMIGTYEKYQKLVVVPNSKYQFKAKVEYTLSLSFNGTISKAASNSSDNGGLLLSSYVDDQGKTRNYIIANFFPVYARRAFPCFDEPSFKAPISLTLRRPPTYNSTSTESIYKTVESFNQGTEYNWDMYKQTPKMAASSLSIFISQMKSTTNGKLKITAPTKAQATNITGETYWSFISETIDKLTSEKLPTPLTNFVFIPDLFQETVTSWGTIYIRADRILHHLSTNKDKRLTDSLKESSEIGISIANALVTQFYGDAASPGYWDEVWLRNSISEYYGNYIASQYNKNWNINDFMSAHLRTYVLDMQTRVSNMPPIVGNFTGKSIAELTNSITPEQSQKGAALLYMLENSLGTKAFNHTLNQFLKNHWLGSSNSSDLADIWQQQITKQHLKLPYDLTVSKILQPWLRNKGVPVLIVKRIDVAKSPKQTLLLTQATNSTNQMKKSNDASSSPEWYIPITYTTNTERSFNPQTAKTWLGPHTVKNVTQHNLTIVNAVSKKDWVLFDTKAAGLFQVAYDEENLNLLAKQLKKNLSVIPTINRAQIIDDTFLLAWNRFLTYQDGLQLAEYLQNETEYYPWFSAFTGLEMLSLRISQDDLLNQDFTKYISKFLVNLYKHVGFDGHSKDKFTDVLLRAETIKWACRYQIGDCISRANTTMHQILSKKLKQKIEKDYLPGIFCGGLQNADNNTWYSVYNLYKSKRDVYNDGYLLFTLGCSRDKNIIEQYLNLIINDYKTLNSLEAFMIFHASSISQLYLDSLLSFLNSNAVNVQNIYGDDLLTEMILSIAPFLSTSDQRTQLQQLSSQEIGPGPSVALNIALSLVDSTIEWVETTSDQLRIYFHDPKATTFSKSTETTTQIIQTTTQKGSAASVMSSLTLICFITLLTYLF